MAHTKKSLKASCIAGGTAVLETCIPMCIYAALYFLQARCKI